MPLSSIHERQPLFKTTSSGFLNPAPARTGKDSLLISEAHRVREFWDYREAG